MFLSFHSRALLVVTIIEHLLAPELLVQLPNVSFAQHATPFDFFERSQRLVQSSPCVKTLIFSLRTKVSTRWAALSLLKLQDQYHSF